MDDLDRTAAGDAPRVVLVTAPPGDVARRLARELVQRRIAACTNIVAGVTSVYRWRGEVQEDAESLLVLKTVAARVAELEAFLDEHHPYEVPECVVLDPAAVAPKYLAWMRAEAGPE